MKTTNSQDEGSTDMDKALSEWREKADVLPLVSWIVARLDGDSTKIADLFGMDMETKAEFFSWGHNSRYFHVFSPYLKLLLRTDEQRVMGILEGIKNGQRN